MSKYSEKKRRKILCYSERCDQEADRITLVGGTPIWLCGSCREGVKRVS